MLEVRQIQTTLTRTDNNLTGYASVINSPYQVADEQGKVFTEIVRPGAFSRAIQENQDVVALYNHSPDHLLGRSSSHTLKLTEDVKGLWFSVDLPDTELGRAVAELTRRGDLRGASFGFFVQKDRWKGTTREILDVDLVDVSVVVHPANPRSSISMRNQKMMYTYKLRLRQLEE